jgi:hypothetical protein
MAGRVTGALGCALVALALAGCDSAPRTAPAEAALAPGVEALAYLPPAAPVVAVVETDLDGAQWREARAAAVRTGLDPRLEELARRLGAAGVDTDRGRGLLGNLLAWAPAERVAALVVRDSALLDELASSALRTGVLRDGGRHRSARLLAGDGIGLGIRGPVVVAAPTLAGVRRAIDRRETGDGYDVGAFKTATAGLPVRALARAAVDLEALAARHAPRWRAIPYVDALDRAGLALRTTRGGARLDVRVDLDEPVIVRDAPLPANRLRAATPRPFGGIHLGVADLPQLLEASYRGAFAAAPARTARTELATVVVRDRRRLDPARDLLSALAGPATLQLDRDGVFLRAQLADAEQAATAVGRLSSRLPRALAAAGVGGVEMRALAGLKAAVRGSDVLAVFGVLEDVLLVGDGRPATLLERAQVDAADDDDLAPGPLAVRAGPRALDDLFGLRGARELRGWVRPSARGVRAQLRLDLAD